MMIKPPIVGVPRFPSWLARKSIRTTWPTLRARSLRMMKGPTTKAINSAVTVAPAARKLMYPNRLNRM